MSEVSEVVFPSWRYGPQGASQIFQAEADVPEGWEDHPSKVGAPKAAKTKKQAAASAPAAPPAGGPLEPPADEPAKDPPNDEDMDTKLSREQIMAALAARNIEFSKNTPTKALYAKFLAAVESES